MSVPHKKHCLPICIYSTQGKYLHGWICKEYCRQIRKLGRQLAGRTTNAHKLAYPEGADKNILRIWHTLGLIPPIQTLAEPWKLIARASYECFWKIEST